MNTQIFYHGTYEIAPFEITQTGTFEGIFVAEQEVANSHGENVFAIEIDESLILTNYALNYELDHSATNATFERICSSFYSNDEEREALWAAVVEDNADFESLAFVNEDLGESSWICQMLRGRVARTLGYQAVEMNDEHGMTHLVLRGTLSNLEHE